MSWIKKDSTVEVNVEMESDFSKIEVTDAYEVEVIEAYIGESQDKQSKSMSLFVSVKNEDGDTNKSRFTLTGRDGNTFYMGKKNGQDVKKEHFGLSIANTLFNIALGEEIFDLEPSEVEIKKWDNDEKAMVDAKADGFPELVGKKVGVCLQMKREISGTDSKEWGEIAHFFDPETGLMFNEVESDRTKLDKWLKTKKDFIVKEVEAPARSSSFGKKKDESTDGGEAPKRKWGSK